VMWEGGTAPTALGADTTRIYTFYWDGTNYWGLATDAMS
jgi:hypothetical protein